MAISGRKLSGVSVDFLNKYHTMFRNKPIFILNYY
jgi:hypothetical protein